MTRKFILPAAFVALAIAVSSLSAQDTKKTQSVADGYKAPSVTVPYAFAKPKIDGVIGDDEWQGAASRNCLATTGGDVSARQTCFWVMWDEDNIYFAMRSPLRPGERVIQAFREKGKDVNVVFDDSYELWLDVGTKSPDGQPVFFQFLCNYAGVRFDVMHEPAVGNMRTGWTSGWEPANRITPDGKAWEMEVAIPYKSIYKEAPFADGFNFTCLVARNFKRPWEQNSCEGTGSFATREVHSHFTLSKTAPAVHLLSVADIEKRTFGLDLTAYGTAGDCRLLWSFDSDGGVKKNGTLNVVKGKPTKAEGTSLDFDKVPEDAKAPPGSFRIRVTSEDGKTTFLDWCAHRRIGFISRQKTEGEGPSKKTVTEIVNQAVTDDNGAPISDKGDKVTLSLQFNPMRDYLRVTGDFIGYDDRTKIDRCDVEVLADSGDGKTGGKEFAKESFKINELAYVKGIIRMKDLPHGKYLAVMKCLDKDGNAVLERIEKFEKKAPESFEWWNTKAGDSRKVLSPWTPVTVKEGKEVTLGVWGREMTIGIAGLPAKITSQGKDCISGPVSLSMRTDAGEAKGEGAAVKTISKQDFQYAADVESKIGDVQIKSRVTVEYDGMYKVEMTLSPKSPVKVNSLKMSVPMDDSSIEYVYGKGEGIRSGYDMRFMPKDKTGKVWDCLRVDSQPMVVGSFIPYVWLGNTERGLCWFADSDEGWIPDAKVPAVELLRDGKAATLVFNFVGSPATIDAPRTITFAFQASPAKQLQKGWRMDTWWGGDTFTNFAYPDGKGSLIWQSTPFTSDVEACRKLVEGKHNGKFEFYPGGPSRHGNAVPYYEYNTMGYTPEQPYFGEEWKTSAGPLHYGKTLTDFVMFKLDRWVKDCGIDGWYLDNVRPVQCDNIDAGRGYKLPDGRIQPSYNMFGMRDFFLRLRAIWQENGRRSIIVNHMTNNMILPWNGAVDIAYDGEHNVIYPNMGKDFMDLWSLERLRMDYPGQWGVAVNFMNEFQGQWEPAAKAKIMRSYYGAIILHDALPTGNSYTDGQTRSLMAARDKFGIGEDDVKFLAYWDKDSGMKTETKDVYLAGWLRPGKILIAVVNFGEKNDASIAIDAAKLGLKRGWKASDAEEGTVVNAYDQGLKQNIKVWDAASQGAVCGDGAGKLTVPVERHDFRLVLLEGCK